MKKYPPLGKLKLQIAAMKKKNEMKLLLYERAFDCDNRRVRIHIRTDSQYWIYKLLNYEWI